MSNDVYILIIISTNKIKSAFIIDMKKKEYMTSIFLDKRLLY